MCVCNVCIHIDKRLGYCFRTVNLLHHSKMAGLNLNTIFIGKSAVTLISEDVNESIRDLVARLRTRQQFRGLGGELMRQACCHCIAQLSLAGAPYHTAETIGEITNV